MRNRYLIDNKTGIESLNSFNDEFSSKIENICPYLKMFSIHIQKHTQSKYLKEVNFNDIDAFAFYFEKNKPEASSAYAEIIVNTELCQKLDLTELEMLAAVAHEIGHIIMLLDDKANCQGQAEEVYCDEYASKIGLAKPLCSLLKKLIASNLYSEEQLEVMRNRLLFTIPYIINDSNRI